MLEKPQQKQTKSLKSLAEPIGRLHVELPKSMILAIKQRALDDGVNVRRVIAAAVSEYLKINKKIGG